METLFAFTLNQYLRALTQVWVVSLQDTKLTPAPLLQPSTQPENSEFDKKARPLGPVLSNQYLYIFGLLQPG
jgi:hypothetical protein